MHVSLCSRQCVVSVLSKRMFAVLGHDSLCMDRYRTAWRTQPGDCGELVTTQTRTNKLKQPPPTPIYKQTHTHTKNNQPTSKQARIASNISDKDASKGTISETNYNKLTRHCSLGRGHDLASEKADFKMCILGGPQLPTPLYSGVGNPRTSHFPI